MKEQKRTVAESLLSSGLVGKALMRWYSLSAAKRAHRSTDHSLRWRRGTAAAETRRELRTIEATAEKLSELVPCNGQSAFQTQPANQKLPLGR